MTDVTKITSGFLSTLTTFHKTTAAYPELASILRVLFATLVPMEYILKAHEF